MILICICLVNAMSTLIRLDIFSGIIGALFSSCEIPVPNLCLLYRVIAIYFLLCHRCSLFVVSEASGNTASQSVPHLFAHFMMALMNSMNRSFKILT